MAITWMYAQNASVGTSTTRTQLNGATNITLPEAARCIRSIIPLTVAVTPTAAQATYIKIDLTSNDFPILPYDVPAPVVSSQLGAGGFVRYTAPERFPINTNVNGGAQLGVWGTALVANTAAPYAGASVEISTDPAPLPRVKAKMGTITSTGTSAATVSGTAYQFTGGTRLIEAWGTTGATTVAAKEAVAGYFKLESTEFDPNLPVNVPIIPQSSGLSVDAAGTASNVEGADRISRTTLDIGIRPANTRIQDYAVFSNICGTAGYFLTGVLYI